MLKIDYFKVHKYMQPCFPFQDTLKAINRKQHSYAAQRATTFFASSNNIVLLYHAWLILQQF